MLRKYPYLLDPAATDASGGVEPKIDPTPQADAVAPKPTEGDAALTPAVKAPEAEAVPVAGKDDPLLQALFRDLKPETPEIVPVVEKPEAKVVEPVATPPAAKPEEKKTPRKKKASILSELDAPAPQPASVQAPSPAPAPAPARTDPDEEYVAGLTDEQKDELSESEYAEKLFTDKYKGRRKALIKWYRELDAAATRLLAEDPERKLNEDDADWQKFMRTKPRMESAHTKAVQRAIGAEAAVKQVEQKYEPKLAALDRKQQEIEFRPKIDGVVQEFTAGVRDLLAQDEKSPMAESIKFAKEKGDDEAAKEFPLETQIRNEEVSRAADMTREYFLFAKQLRTFDGNNATHAGLLQFINEEGARFTQHGGDMLVREGKRFLPREEYMRLASANPAEAGKHWTFSHRDVVEMLAFQTKINIENRLKAEESRAKAMGFERRARKNLAPAQTPKEVEPINPPKATPHAQQGDGHQYARKRRQHLAQR